MKIKPKIGKKKSWWNSNFKDINEELKFWYKKSEWTDQLARVEWVKCSENSGNFSE